jgi:hypothetical protein
MKGLSNPARAKRRVGVDAALFLIVLLLVAQMWLLTATLESYLAGHHEVAMPGMLLSLALFLGSAGLYGFVARLDKTSEPEDRPLSDSGPWMLS